MLPTKSNGKGNVERAEQLVGTISPTNRKCKPFLGRKALRTLSTALLSSVLSAASMTGDYKITSPPIVRHTEEVPFTLYREYLIVVDGRIGSLEHQKLLLDTGTSPSMIDKAVAEKLGLQGTRGQVTTFSKSVPVNQAQLADLQVGPLRAQNLVVMVADFSKVEKTVGAHIDAIVGLDVLSTTGFTIDYSKHRILFQPTRERHSVPFAVSQQFLQVTLKSGNKQLHLLVDTGTPQLILFDRALHDLDYSRIAHSTVGTNLSGGAYYDTVVLPEAQLGRESVGPQRVTVVAAEKKAESEYDGLLGVLLLHPKRLSFDFAHQVLEWSN